MHYDTSKAGSVHFCALDGSRIQHTMFFSITCQAAQEDVMAFIKCALVLKWVLAAILFNFYMQTAWVWCHSQHIKISWANYIALHNV